MRSDVESQYWTLPTLIQSKRAAGRSVICRPYRNLKPCWRPARQIRNRRSVCQHFERVRPLVSQQARQAPEAYQWFERAGAGNAAAIEGLPAKLADHVGDLRFGALVLAAEEHGGCALLVKWVYHARVAYTVECLHYVCTGQQSLNAFGQ